MSMKLRISPNDFGPKFSCIDDNEYDGAPDAGPQLVGLGDTEEAAKEDFMDQRLQREAERDAKRAVNNMRLVDGMLDKLFGGR